MQDRHIGRIRPWLGAAAVVALLCVGCASGPDSRYSFDATPGRLPKTVVPIRYVIDLRPDLSAATFSGSEVVDIEVRVPSDRIVLNVLDLAIIAARLDDEAAGTAEIAVDKTTETATLTFPRPLAAGPHKLRIEFTGKINPFSRGLYYADYPTASGRKRMLASHLEPADARRIFPGWDEPAFKAVFEIAVTAPQAFLAVSNMPAVGEEPVDSGHKRVRFAPTPKMSAYLVVVAAGELERLSDHTGNTEVSVVATAGKAVNGRYALDTAMALLNYYNDYFGVPYPLPKLDLIAVPGGFGGAMENWGGITFFESRLLYDPASSPPDARRDIFFITAHEMAHLWFGDLVTTAWWDNLWLNEGFASWMQTKAGDDLHPEWRPWVNTSSGKQFAMSEDARRSTHPIQQPVADESEAMSVFDGITYSKGQAFIRMLEDYIGADPFRAGIGRYMREHAFSNATTADLWSALEAASGKPVAPLAAAFTEQPGLPLVASAARCDGAEQLLRLTQERFTVHDPEAKALRWRVPVAFGPASGTAPSQHVLLDGTAEVAAGPCGVPVKLNRGDIGYYRVQYDAASHAALVRAFPGMGLADRANLLADDWALIEAGRMAPAQFFELVDRVAAADERAVWNQILRIFGRIDFLERGRPGRAAFRAYARTRLKPVFDRLGWDPVAGEPEDRTILRAQVIRSLGDFGDASVLAEAKRRYSAYMRNRRALPSSLRDAVVHLAGRTANAPTYDRLRALARRTTVTEERVLYYNALAAALDPALADRTLKLALADDVPPSLSGRLIFGVAGAEHPDLAWTFVKENFPALLQRQGTDFRNYIAGALLSNFTDRGAADELARFEPAHATAGGRIGAARATEAILTNADFCEHQLPAIDQWIQQRSGA